MWRKLIIAAVLAVTGAIGGGVITYTAGGAQKVALAAGFSMLAWPTKPVHAKVAVLGLDAPSASR
jgi:hypothetical protein